MKKFKKKVAKHHIGRYQVAINKDNMGICVYVLYETFFFSSTALEDEKVYNMEYEKNGK